MVVHRLPSVPWLWIGVAAFVAGLGGSAAYLLDLDDEHSGLVDTVSDLGGAASIPIGLAALGVSAAALFLAYRQTAALRPVLLDQAAARIAESVARQLDQEADTRLLLRPHPIQVNWRSTEIPVAAPARDVLGPGVVGGRPTRLRLRGDVTTLAAGFRRLPARRLVILGRAGSGKTTLAMLLTKTLIAEPRPEDRVPVLFALPSWNPSSMSLHEWMAGELDRAHQDRRDRIRFGRRCSMRLIADGRILPVLDGFDEMLPDRRDKMIAALNGQSTGIPQFVLTSRSEEFAGAVRQAGSPLARTAVVETQDLDAEQVVAYLSAARLDGVQRWAPIAERLRDAPDAPVSRALSTPLMAFLARVAYADARTDPAELRDEGRFGNHLLIESHLLARFVPATYAYSDVTPNGKRRATSYTPKQAARWLRTLIPRSGGQGDDSDRIAGLFQLPEAWNIHGWWRVPMLPLYAFWGALFFSTLLVGVVLGAGAGAIAVPLAAAFELWKLIRFSPPKQIPKQAAKALGRTLLTMPIRGGLVGIFGLMALLVGGAALLILGWNYLLLAATGRIPWRLRRFVEDAHARGVLRRQGDSYLFRHARIRAHLAGLPRPPAYSSGRSRYVKQLAELADRQCQAELARLSDDETDWHIAIQAAGVLAKFDSGHADRLARWAVEMPEFRARMTAAETLFSSGDPRGGDLLAAFMTDTQSSYLDRLRLASSLLGRGDARGRSFLAGLVDRPEVPTNVKISAAHDLAQANDLRSAKSLLRGMDAAESSDRHLHLAEQLLDAGDAQGRQFLADAGRRAPDSADRERAASLLAMHGDSRGADMLADIAEDAHVLMQTRIKAAEGLAGRGDDRGHAALARAAADPSLNAESRYQADRAARRLRRGR